MKQSQNTVYLESRRLQEDLLRSGTYIDGSGFGVVFAMKELEKRGR